MNPEALVQTPAHPGVAGGVSLTGLNSADYRRNRNDVIQAKEEVER